MNKILFGGAVAVVVLAGAWYLGSPFFIDKEVSEELPFEMPTPEAVAQMSPTEAQESHKKTLAMLATKPAKSMNEGMSEGPQPKLLSKGQFSDVDAIHKGKGDALLYQLTDGSHLLRLENFEASNGPDLYVYLVKHPNPASSEDVQAGFINLGRLKGNIGNQNYPINNETDILQYKSAVIYCKLFGVLFSPAPLKTP